MSYSTQLRSDSRPGVRDRGRQLFQAGRIRDLHGGPEYVSARVSGETGVYRVELEREDDDILASCGCKYFDSEGLCKHIWAVVLAADVGNYLLGRDRRPPV